MFRPGVHVTEPGAEQSGHPPEENKGKPKTGFEGEKIIFGHKHNKQAVSI